MKQFEQQEILNLQIQHKRDTLNNWLSNNPPYTPLEGELIVVTDPKGPGENPYQDVKYVLVGDGNYDVRYLIQHNAIQLGSITDYSIKKLFPELHPELK